jgi:tetratricopeptide (TPR) repeat protein
MDNTIKLEDLFYQADLDIKDGYFTEAVKKLEEILHQDPDFGKAYNHLGWLHETQFRNLEKAEDFYKLAVAKSPTYPAAYYNYAILLSTLERFDDLDNLLKKALEVKGIEKAKIYNEYGIMFEQIGEYEKAIRFYTDAAKSTLNKDMLNTAKDSIERCKVKTSL